MKRSSIILGAIALFSLAPLGCSSQTEATTNGQANQATQPADNDAASPEAVDVEVDGQAVPEIRTERIQFEPGANSAFVEDAITGYEIVDYVLDVQEGQSANISMATDNLANYFNILAPGETAEALFIGSTSGNQYEGTLPETGDYTVRVYLMRSAARRDEVANYRLEMNIGSGNPPVSGAAEDALVAGTNFNATGQVPCAMGLSQPMGACPFGVVRQGSGSGMVTITLPTGGIRTITFDAGNAVSSNADADLSAEKQRDLSVIRIGEERYEIPDAVIFGG
ncbi:MAG: hypothetical protein AAF289_00140 [Cyanobacteria bacterium P01_A01_bin.135]